MSTQADALEVMALVAACHHRTAPRMDDREVTLATAKVWAELFTEYRLELPDLLAAVKKRAARQPEAPEPAEIIAFARDIRRDRDAQHGPSVNYQMLCESKSDDADDLAAIRQRRITDFAASTAARKSIR